MGVVRVQVLAAAIKVLRERSTKDRLNVVSAPAGILGYRGQVAWEAQKYITSTTVGRVLFYSIVPKQIPFHHVDKALGKKALGNVIDLFVIENVALRMLYCLQMLLWVWVSPCQQEPGISICIDDMEIPESKRELFKRAEEEVLKGIKVALIMGT